MNTEPDFARALRHAMDPAAWAQEVLGFIPDPWQRRVLQSRNRRVLLNISRQAGKSTVTAKLALHTALFNPKSLILVFSKAQRQSTELVGKLREDHMLIKGEAPLSKDATTEVTLSNGSRILSLPGDGSTTRGFSAPNVIILDEAAFIADSLYEAFMPMMANGKTRLFMLSTPNGKVGVFANAWLSGSSIWQRESVTAWEIPRISHVFLREAIEELGPARFSQEFECKFIDAEGQYFSDEAITRAFSRDVQPLDLAL